MPSPACAYARNETHLEQTSPSYWRNEPEPDTAQPEQRALGRARTYPRSRDITWNACTIATRAEFRRVMLPWRNRARGGAVQLYNFCSTVAYSGTERALGVRPLSPSVWWSYFGTQSAWVARRSTRIRQNIRARSSINVDGCAALDPPSGESPVFLAIIPRCLTMMKAMSCAYNGGARGGHGRRHLLAEAGPKASGSASPPPPMICAPAMEPIASLGWGSSIHGSRARLRPGRSVRPA